MGIVINAAVYNPAVHSLMRRFQYLMFILDGMSFLRNISLIVYPEIVYSVRCTKTVGTLGKSADQTRIFSEYTLGKYESFSQVYSLGAYVPSLIKTLPLYQAVVKESKSCIADYFPFSFFREIRQRKAAKQTIYIHT